MSTENPRADGTRESDLAVMEKTEFKQKHRLNQILQAHDKVETKANEAWDFLVAGEITHDGKNIMIQRAVKEFVRECYNLLLEHHKQVKQARAAREQAAENGAATNGNAADNDDDWPLVDYWNGEGAPEPIGTIEMHRADDKEIYGLSDFIQTNELYQESWQVREKPRNMAVRTSETVVEHSVPEDVSWTAYLWLREFLNEQYSLDLQFEGEGLDEDKMIPDY